MEVEDDQVRLDLGEDLLDLPRIVGTEDRLIPMRTQQTLEHREIVGLVIDEEDLRVECLFVPDGLPTPHCVAACW